MTEKHLEITELFAENRTGSWQHRISKGSKKSCEIEFHYLKYDGKDADSSYTVLKLDKINVIEENSDSGILVQAEKNQKKLTIWLPLQPEKFHFDENGRIDEKKIIPVNSEWVLNQGVRINVIEAISDNIAVCATVVIINDPELKYFEELSSFTGWEKRRFLKSSWFDAKSPADFWSYFIDGNVYDPRSHKGVGKRFKCQQCALSWWEYFGFLSKKTGKEIYGFLQDEIAASIIAEFQKEGKWRHGYWYDSMEIHSRFYLDGVHLLLSQFEKEGDVRWLNHARDAVDYLTEHLTDHFKNGNIWYVHDSVEEKRNHKFKSVLFGKHPDNSLCINTHVQALCVLKRLTAYDDNNHNYHQFYESGFEALIRVLRHQPASFLYRRFESQAFKLTAKEKKRGHLTSNLFSLGNRIHQRLYWTLCKKYPRLVYENGFIERDLTLSMMSARYHIINVKDLLLLYMADPNPQLLPFIEKGVRFIDDFLTLNTLENALNESPYFIEYLDILYLYSRLFEKIDVSKIEYVEKAIVEVMGGSSLDFYSINSLYFND